MATPDTTGEPEVPDDPLVMARNLLAHMRAAVAYSASPDPEKQIMSHINRVGAQAYQDSEVAGRLALVSIAEDVRRVADHIAGRREKIRRGTGEDDWLYCLCGNRPDLDGFAACAADGTPVEPVGPPVWDGALYVCSRCGRIVNQHTLEVVGRRAERLYAVSYRELSTGLRETTAERYATLGEAVEAYRAMRRDDAVDDGLPSSDPRVEYDGRPVDIEAPVTP